MSLKEYGMKEIGKKTYSIIMDLWFFIPYTIWLWYQALSITFFWVEFRGEKFDHIILYCVLALVIRELFLLKDVSKKEVIGALCILWMIIILSPFPDRYSYLSLLIVIYCMRNTDYKKVLAVTGFVVAGVLLYTFFSAYTGRIQNYVITQSGDRTRQFLGFRYALFGPAMCFNVTAIYVYLRNKNIKIFELAIIGVLSFIVFRFTDSRLSFYFTLLLLILTVVIKHFSLENRKILYYLLAASFILCFLISIMAALHYDATNPILAKLNTILGSRLQLMKSSFDTYGIHLLGQKIDMHGNGLNAWGQKSNGVYNYVDNFYMHYGQVYGLIFMSIMGIGVTLSSIKSKDRKDIYLPVILSLFCLHGLIDDLMFPLYYNAFFCSAIYLCKGKKEEKESTRWILRILLIIITALMMNYLYGAYIVLGSL